MRIIVMDEDMSEPLTVVEVPQSLMNRVETGMRYICIPVPVTMQAWFTNLDKIPNVTDPAISVVKLRMEPICTSRNGERQVLFWTAIPDNPTLALLLRAAFLPGQMTELRRREAQAWFQGAMAVVGGG